MRLGLLMSPHWKPWTNITAISVCMVVSDALEVDWYEEGPRRARVLLVFRLQSKELPDSCES